MYGLFTYIRWKMATFKFKRELATLHLYLQLFTYISGLECQSEL